MATTLKEKMASLPAGRRKRIEARAAVLIAEEMSLRELRKAHGKTQDELAARLNMSQDGVSRLESRSDLLLSTMQHFVESLGGELELVARFPNREAVKLTGFGERRPQVQKTKKGASRPRSSRASSQQQTRT
jgi:transcriptional regulator with XRE-family HTH domain